MAKFSVVFDTDKLDVQINEAESTLATVDDLVSATLLAARLYIALHTKSRDCSSSDVATQSRLDMMKQHTKEIIMQG